MALPQDISPVNSELMDSLARTSAMEWIETKPGQAWLKVLWVGPETGRWAVLLKWRKGYVAPPHKHLSAAHTFIMSGRLQVRDGVRAFALYNYAIALSQTDAMAAAADAFRNFQDSFPGSNEAALAALQEADLLYEIGDLEIANQKLDAFYMSKAPATLRMQARLRALQIASESDDSARTRNILFGTDWNVAAMPDIAVLSFAALPTLPQLGFSLTSCVRLQTEAAAQGADKGWLVIILGQILRLWLFGRRPLWHKEQLQRRLTASPLLVWR